MWIGKPPHDAPEPDTAKAGCESVAKLPGMRKSTTRTVTRQTLYDFIWDRPMWKVAPEFGLSGNGLAKLCRRHGIPVPERGYWAKIAHGKRVRKPPLPNAPKGEGEEIVIEASPPGRTALETAMPEPLAALLKAEREATEPIDVPQSPKPHPIVAAWPTKKGVAEARRRRIATAFIREVEKRGGTVTAPPRDDRYSPTWIDTQRFIATFFGTSIKIALQERQRMVDVPKDPTSAYHYPRKSWEETGLLRLRFDEYFDVPVRREWKETAEKPLEGRLREMLIGLYIAVEAERRRNERFAAEQRGRAAAEMHRLEAEEKRRKEDAKIKTLIVESQAWAEAKRIRQYVAASIKKKGRLKREWAAWALSIADGIDPLCSKRIHA